MGFFTRTAGSARVTTGHTGARSRHEGHFGNETAKCTSCEGLTYGRMLCVMQSKRVVTFRNQEAHNSADETRQTLKTSVRSYTGRGTARQPSSLASGELRSGVR